MRMRRSHLAPLWEKMSSIRERMSSICTISARCWRREAKLLIHWLFCWRYTSRYSLSQSSKAFMSSGEDGATMGWGLWRVMMKVRIWLPVMYHWTMAVFSSVRAWISLKGMAWTFMTKCKARVYLVDFPYQLILLLLPVIQLLPPSLYLVVISLLWLPTTD